MPSSPIFPRALTIALAALTLTGCGASARFHSKTGRKYEPVTNQAVRCGEPEAQTVAAAGGEVIGTISGKALAAHADHEDVTDRAQDVTHLQTVSDRRRQKKGGHAPGPDRKGRRLFYSPQARPDHDGVRSKPGYRGVPVCRNAPKERHLPAAEGDVRLGPERWASLPSQLRPVPRDP